MIISKFPQLHKMRSPSSSLNHNCGTTWSYRKGLRYTSKHCIIIIAIDACQVHLEIRSITCVLLHHVHLSSVQCWSGVPYLYCIQSVISLLRTCGSTVEPLRSLCTWCCNLPQRCHRVPYHQLDRWGNRVSRTSTSWTGWTYVASSSVEGQLPPQLVCWCLLSW